MNKEAAKIFSRLRLADRTVRVKLLGDSITHGVGGSGFEQSGVQIVEGWNRNPDGYCWAKRLKEQLESRYCCEVINNGCTGTTVQFVLEHFDELVEDEDDIILCTIGTNNRHQYFHETPRHTRQEHMEIFYQNILKLHERLKATGKEYILVANIPASAENEKDGPDYYRLLHMNDICDLYTKAAAECGFVLIRMYDLFLQYCKEKGITVDSLLCDGLHPNDAGYDVMYELLLEELGLTE